MERRPPAARRLAVVAARGALALAGAVAAAVIHATAARAEAPPDTLAVARARAAYAGRVRADAIPGLSAAVAVRGRLAWSEAFGEADREAGVPATTATQFGIGSITQSLTMALAARLSDQGRLDLDAPVERYLPGFPYAGRGISVRLVGGHLAGLGDAFANAHRMTDRHYDTAEALAEILKEPHATGPYTVIAAVVEAVTGEPFVDAMRHLVLEPLKMTATAPNDPRRPAPRCTVFYETDEVGRPVPAPRYDPSHKLAGAGYLSTSEDLVRFGSALFEPGFLSAAAVERLFTPLRTRDGADTGVGLGFRIGPAA